jgi:hypothetical protein
MTLRETNISLLTELDGLGTAGSINISLLTERRQIAFPHIRR